MDTTTSSPSPATGTDTFHLDIDPRPLFAAATETATEVIGNVRADQLANPTPCTEYDVRQLLRHLVGVLPRVVAMGRGDDPMRVTAPDIDGLPDDDVMPAWLAAVAEAKAAWADGSALERTIVLPWATDTGAVALLGYVSEVTVHTWDVAHATGQTPAWNAQAVENAYALIRNWLPGEGRAEIFAEVRKKMGPAAAAPDAFAEVVPVPDDAPLIDRLVAWNGRRP
ncbi:MAG: hypothetical protein QOH28_2144 [Actinomycetota bacterium]|jgi:uncharacterized protein (TIGR03086 family)|nr:hypothetical protein [Actinomycetota bacterium]